MSKFCYHCGQKLQNAAYCPQCGFDTNPPRDVYCGFETCDTKNCVVDIPRWSKFCPECGKPIPQYDPTDKAAARERQKGLRLGALVWTFIVFGIALAVGLTQEGLPLTVTLIIAAVLSVFLWITVLCRKERGKVLYGTVGRQWTEVGTESQVVSGEKNLLGHRYFREIPVTYYKTDIHFDDGTKDTMMMQDCAADHIQLKPGDRVCKYPSTGVIVKI